MSEDEGYKKLGISQLAHDLAIEVHTMTLRLPRWEMSEEGSQRRRSSKSVAAQIVEGYGLRIYKKDFLLYLHRAYASTLEIVEHLELAYKTGSHKAESLHNRLVSEYSLLAKKLMRFIQAVTSGHDRPLWVMEEDEEYDSGPSQAEERWWVPAVTPHATFKIQDPKSHI
jgi:four helix bundle protein